MAEILQERERQVYRKGAQPFQLDCEKQSAAGVSSNGMVHLGSKVSLKKGDAVLNYTVVGSSEADPVNGLISNESPLGRELLAKKSGDNIQILLFQRANKNRWLSQVFSSPPSSAVNTGE